jgi:hypothetical protein
MSKAMAGVEQILEARVVDLVLAPFLACHLLSCIASQPHHTNTHTHNSETCCCVDITTTTTTTTTTSIRGSHYYRLLLGSVGGCGFAHCVVGCCCLSGGESHWVGGTQSQPTSTTATTVAQ